MPQIFYFMLKVILCSGILFGYYHLFLRNKIYHAYNRYYLLCAVILSLTVPLLQFDIYNSKDETQLQPIQMLQVVNNSDAYIEEIITTSHTKNVELSDVLLTGYIAIAMVFFVSFILLLFRVFSLIRKSEKNDLNNIIIINSTAEGTPFSFFRYLFWNSEIDINTETGRHIFSHELAHIRERHSLDKVFMNTVLILCWINPFFWLIRKELNMIHEFIADKKAVGEYDTAVLASMIIQTAYPKHNFLSTNHFFYSPIKRRLLMLSKYRSARATYFTRILVLPVLFLLIAAFTFKAKNHFQPKIEKDFIVVIDAGHGGKDDGARAVDGTYEKNLNLTLAKMVKELNTNERIKIILTRETDVYQSPKEKAEISNNLKADLFISIHVSNTPQKYIDVTSGMEVYVARDSFQNSIDSKTFASAVIGAFSKNYKLKINPNPIQRPKGIWVLQKSKCPAVLIEAGYISHTGDRDYLKSKVGMESFATNVLAAVQNYLAQPMVTEKSDRPLAIANVLGLTKDQVNTTNGSGDTIPKFAKDMLGLKGNEEKTIENANFLLRSKGDIAETERSIIVIDNKVYTVHEISNKRITAKRARVYGKNNKMIIEKYGKRASDGAIIFEDAVIEDLPDGKYDVVLDKARNNLNMDASQRLNQKDVNLNEPTRSLNANTIRLNGGLDSLKQPIHLLDGKRTLLPTLKAMDPQLIKSIDVLKGAAAELQYGLEAKHGAILISTKKLEEFATDGLKTFPNEWNGNVESVGVNGYKLTPGFKNTDPEITLSGIHSGRIPINRLNEIIDVRTNVPGYKVTNATIYFVGAGFPNVTTATLQSESLAGIIVFLKRIKAGTTITLDNIEVESADGKKIKLRGQAFTFFEEGDKSQQP